MDMFSNTESPDNDDPWDLSEDMFQQDPDGNVLKIQHPDGSITISMDGKSLVNEDKNKSDKKWFSNLAEDMGEYAIASICEMLLRRIEEDIEARQQKIGLETKEVMNLLGFTRKANSSQSSSVSMGGIPNSSELRHPLLLESVVSFQAAMHAELLPADGPLKIHDYSTTRMGNPTGKSGKSDAIDELADDFETLMNHYLLEGAPEYYPELDRMLFMGGAMGDGFQKVFNCPMRERPVIETVNYDRLIVNVGATHMSNALRITQIAYISENTIRRMQILGIYRDVTLVRSLGPKDSSPYDNAKDIFQGVDSSSRSPDDEDIEREIYECRCELNIPGYEHKVNGKISGLKVPYVVTMDKDSREILSITRNYLRDDNKQRPIDCFVQFPFIPADYGFYSIGLAKLLENPTRALSRGWMISLDNGELHNFPGLIYDQQAFRADTNIMNVPAGGAAPCKLPIGKSIRDVLMPLPYPDLSPTFQGFLDNIAQSFKSVTNATEALIAEGRTDAPVGTTIALIEAAQKVTTAVHKRYLAAQGKTFKILMECFKRDPEAFFRFDKSATRNWDMQLFMAALDRFNLVPKADPNTASHIQRMAKEEFKMSLMDKYPDMFDKYDTLLSAMRAAKISNPEVYLIPPSPSDGRPSPELQIQQQLAQAKLKDADSKGMMAQARMEQNKVDMIDSQADAENRMADRESRERVERLQLMKEIAIHHDQMGHEERQAMREANSLVSNPNI